jgi:hypothetical protein
LDLVLPTTLPTKEDSHVEEDAMWKDLREAIEHELEEGYGDDYPCQGCGSVCVYKDDVNQYRVGYWCSRFCAISEFL